MANANVAFGLKPVRYASGAPYNGAVNAYAVPASDSTPLMIGDPVILAGSADAGTGAATITRATAAGGNRITGVVQGFVPTPSIVANGYRLASTDAVVLVADDPDLLFEIQEDAVGGALPLASIGLNADLIAASGSTVTKRSGFQLDTSTAATTATLQLRIERFVNRADNEVASANAKVLVRINLPTQTGAAGSTGV